MSLLPKEHGAYGQISFPLVAAFAVGGVSAGGLLIASALIAGFLAHEPALVMLGLRGPRAKRELWNRAAVWLVCSLLIGGAAAIGAAIGGAIWHRYWTQLVPRRKELREMLHSIDGEGE